jgi:hypothetical protein
MFLVTAKLGKIVQLVLLSRFLAKGKNQQKNCCKSFRKYYKLRTLYP